MNSKSFFAQITKNLRFGFATNSSSTHSVVFVGDRKINDKEVTNYNYGWDDFILASLNAKEKYLLTTLAMNISRFVNKDNLSVFFQMVFPNEEHRIKQLMDGTIDHQSLITIPRLAKTWDDNELDMEFFYDLKRFVLSEDMIIMGGDDNHAEGEIRPSPSDYGQEVLQLIPTDYREMVSRYNGNYYMLFDKEHGVKLRIQFSMNTPVVADSPELVDVKITDYCESGCRFCYQDSTKEGKHGEWDFIKKLFNSFRPYTEIALGGGDVAKHPNIDSILQHGAGRNLIMNITVNDIDWLENERVFNAFNQNVKGIGISVSQKRDFEKIEKLNERMNENIQFSVHFIPDLFNLDMLESLMAYVSEFNQTSSRKVSILLLGYKTIGRGDHSKHQKIENFAEELHKLSKEYWGVSVGVDTKFIQDYPEIKNFVNRRLYTEHEGEFSMYVDAVKETAHASSYNIEQGHSLKVLNKEWYGKEQLINDVFQTIQKETLK